MFSYGRCSFYHQQKQQKRRTVERGRARALQERRLSDAWSEGARDVAEAVAEEAAAKVVAVAAAARAAVSE